MIPDRFTPAVLDDIEHKLGALGARRLKDLRARRAAVLLSLCERDGAAAVLFTKRSDNVGTHKGHVSFPGGMEDQGDRDLVGTALRETEEEIGVGPADVRVLGRFHEARAITGVKVLPVVGFVGEVADFARFAPNPEIDTLFALTLDELVDPQKRDLQRLGVRKAPVFEAGPHPVWGLTAYILEAFLVEVLGAPPTTAR